MSAWQRDAFVMAVLAALIIIGVLFVAFIRSDGSSPEGGRRLSRPRAR
jgi:hypothetical protein